MTDRDDYFDRRERDTFNPWGFFFAGMFSVVFWCGVAWWIWG